MEVVSVIITNEDQISLDGIPNKGHAVNEMAMV